VSDSDQRPNRKLWGMMLVIAALLYAAVAAGIIGVDPSSLKAPSWVLYLVAVGLAAGGGLMISGQRSRFSDLLAALFLLAMAGIGGWSALFSPAEGISGGLVFLPQEVNKGLGRALFGLGAALCLTLAFYAIRRASKPEEE
jgi:CHASE2 domain-containing sensor protein